MDLWLNKHEKHENDFLYLKCKMGGGGLLWGKEKCHYSFFCSPQIMLKPKLHSYEENKIKEKMIMMIIIKTIIWWEMARLMLK
jgi:hypothetical protein